MPARLTAIAAYVKGNARPSLSPASDVTVKRASSSSLPSSVTGSLTCTSLASTGSVGASAAASSRAAAAPSPEAPPADDGHSDDREGHVIPSSRHVVDQVRQANLRLIARPAPIRDTITQSSVMCSASSGCAIGSGSGIRLVEREGAHAGRDEHHGHGYGHPAQQARQERRHQGRDARREVQQAHRIQRHPAILVAVACRRETGDVACVCVSRVGFGRLASARTLRRDRHSADRCERIALTGVTRSVVTNLSAPARA